jgi:hypothetical protein
MVPVHPNGPRVADSAEVVHDHRNGLLGPVDLVEVAHDHHNGLQWGRVVDSVAVAIARVDRAESAIARVVRAELAIAQVDVLHPAIWVIFLACLAGAAVHGRRNYPVAAWAQWQVVPVAAEACSGPAAAADLHSFRRIVPVAIAEESVIAEASAIEVG